MQTSLLNTDPVAAVLDTWAFIFQMTAYMERPALKQKFGESYPVVAETLRNMDAEMEQLVRVGAPTANVADFTTKHRREWYANDSSKQIGIEHFGAHDLRRTCAKLCRKNGGDLEQIKFLLGHSSIQTTERYLGSDQDIEIAVNDNLGL